MKDRDKVPQTTGAQRNDELCDRVFLVSRESSRVSRNVMCAGN